MKLEELKTETSKLVETRTEARQKALLAIKSMEQALIDSLQGESLQGLPNLGTNAAPFKGVRVRAAPAKQLDRSNGKRALCINRQGRLVIVSYQAGNSFSHFEESVQIRPALEADLVAEDVAKVRATIAGAIDHHLRRIAKHQSKFEALLNLSERLIGDE